MAYARFSSDSWRSDVYTWADVSGGYVTHVAGARHVFSAEHPMPELKDDSVEAFVAWYQEQREAIDHATLEPIDGTLDSERFVADTPTECAEQLLYIRSQGYHVPQSAIDDLLKEAEEHAA